MSEQNESFNPDLGAGDLGNRELLQSAGSRFLTWTLKGWNPKYAVKLRGILNIIHVFLSILIFALVRSACQIRLFEDGDSGFYRFYCKSSYTFHLVTGSGLSSFLFFVCCLLSKKTETRLFTSSFETAYYIIYLTLLSLLSAALVIPSLLIAHGSQKEYLDAKLAAAKRLKPKEAGYKVFLKILMDSICMTGAVVGGIPLGVNMLGFRANGVVAGSLAATYQGSFLRGSIGSGCLFATLQRVGAVGLAASTKLAVLAGSAVAATYERIFN